MKPAINAEFITEFVFVTVIFLANTTELAIKNPLVSTSQMLSVKVTLYRFNFEDSTPNRPFWPRLFENNELLIMIGSVLYPNTDIAESLTAMFESKIVQFRTNKEPSLYKAPPSTDASF
jgi:hypothetical protein